MLSIVTTSEEVTMEAIYHIKDSQQKLSVLETVHEEATICHLIKVWQDKLISFLTIVGFRMFKTGPHKP